MAARHKSKIGHNGGPPLNVKIDVPPIYAELWQPARYKVYWGGRGSGKSWSIAYALISLAFTKKLRILCAREFQSSIKDSVHRLLADRIEELGLTPFFKIEKDTITCKITGSTFVFKGIRTNVQEFKSTEGIDICWLEEAQSVSADSWQVIIPTIRKSGSEIWSSFNPYDALDPTYQRFVINPPPNAIVRKTGWQDNPAFGQELEDERLYMLRTDPEAYDWIWEGNVKQISNAIVFKNRVRIDRFDPPDDAIFYHGADWGFAVDPTVLVRCYIDGRRLFIDREAYGVGVTLDKTPELFDQVETARDWTIHADNARPETISFVGSKGFQIRAAEKWPGSVEDGVEHLKAFEEIVIHESCTHVRQEFRLYSYKQDPKTKQIFPKLTDQHNHTIDALRYSLDGFIQRRGAAAIWAKMAEG